jgi:hypothetical protein
MQSRAHLLRQLNHLRIAKYLHSQLRLDHDHRAILALQEMELDLSLHRDIHIAIDVVGDLEKDAVAVQFGFLSRI